MCARGTTHSVLRIFPGSKSGRGRRPSGSPSHSHDAEDAISAILAASHTQSQAALQLIY